MYTVAFYSFKGGVGRTMALMNVAMALVNQGRRVLVVDFDLEAPGAGTFEIFSEAGGTPGVLEFVSEYVATGQSPDVRRYVHQVAQFSKGELLFMPAGCHDDTYGHRLSEADWGDLYENRNGYLLIEDLKAQWRTSFAPDYVLIDSRTGHTDVAGICTRQLPDAVVVLYFPNEQNLMGLRKVVGDIRSEDKPKEIHFVPSNVPDLDDEDRILAGRLSKFQQDLEFDEPSAVIHHNNSLALLNQVLFVIKRPNSKLAGEYVALTNKIQGANPEDADGAIFFLEEFYSNATTGDDEDQWRDIDDRLIDILTKHPKNEKVLDRLLRIWLYKGDLIQSLNVLDRLIDDVQSERAEYRFRRALLRLGDGDKETILSDARIGLTKEANYYDLRYFLNFVRRSQDTRLYVDMLVSPAFVTLDDDAKMALLKYVAETREAQPVIVGELEAQYSAATDEGKSRLTDVLGRCLIATGRFAEACKVYEEHGRDEPIDDARVANIYNHAVAKWAAYKVADMNLLNVVLAHKFEEYDANTYQCMSLASYLAGDKSEAVSMAAKARHQVLRERADHLSGWRYFRVSPADFMRDIDSQLRMINGESIKPDFLEYKELSLDLGPT